METAFYLLITSGFVGLVIVSARKVVRELESDLFEELRVTTEVYHKLMEEKSRLAREKIKLQNEALEIFTLYEITKEITKSLNEQEALDLFKNKLREHVMFEECLYLDAGGGELKDLRRSKEHFVFTLQSKRKRIGYLAIKGVSENDKEKIMILGHQFALALRRVKLYQEIEQIAITDSLTEVYTRRHTLQRLKEEIQRSQLRKINMSLLMVDVDHFKRFNDKYGHLTGDQILREVGWLIKENIREIDIAGRYGGEEFCVILPDTDRGGAQYAAERIRLAAEQADIKAYDTSVKMTVSIGTATFPNDATRLEELIDKADWALYRCKKSGRNGVCSFGVYGAEDD